MKKIIEKFTRIKSHSKEFHTFFGVHLSKFTSPIGGFNIIAFDNYLIERDGDYQDGKTSMADYINKKYGKSAVKLVKNLIEGK